jgi:hypothetical protein
MKVPIWKSIATASWTMVIFKNNNLARLVQEPSSRLSSLLDRRLKISGAQWRMENVSGILQLRCAYLNGQLAI